MTRIRTFALALVILPVLLLIAPGAEGGRVAENAPRLVSVDAELHVVNLADPQVCEHGVTCKMGLADAQVRVFATAGSPANGEDLVSLFEQGSNVAAAVTDKDGHCVLPVPVDGRYEVIVKWKEPTGTGSTTVYTSQSIGAGPDDTKSRLEVIKLIESNGVVHWSSGKTQVVTG